MNTQQMIDFAKEQLNIFAEGSQMGTFLKNVIDMLDKPVAYDIGDIIESNDDEVRAIILDSYNGSNNEWYVLTEVGCVEHWEEDDFRKVRHSTNINMLMSDIR